MSNVIATCKVNQYVPIHKLKFHPKNPRMIRPERLQQLKDSIIEKGFYQPILVWKKGGIVLAGNHRLRAAQELIDEGYEFHTPKGEINALPAVIEDVDAATAEAILYETNNTYAEWVEDSLRKAIQDAEEAGRSIAPFGFDQSYIDTLLATSLKDALPHTDTSKFSEPSLDSAPAKSESIKEEMCNLILSRPIYDQLADILSAISKKLNKDWEMGDSFDTSAQVLCQLVHESGVLDELK